jgi:hypothetical protein
MIDGVEGGRTLLDLFTAAFGVHGAAFFVFVGGQDLRKWVLAGVAEEVVAQPVLPLDFRLILRRQPGLR